MGLTRPPARKLNVLSSCDRFTAICILLQQLAPVTALQNLRTLTDLHLTSLRYGRQLRMLRHPVRREGQLTPSTYPTYPLLRTMYLYIRVQGGSWNMSWILLQLQALLRSIDPKGLASGLQHSSKADIEILEQGFLFQSLNSLGFGS